MKGTKQFTTKMRGGTDTFLARPSGFGGLDVACWPLVPKFAEAVGFFRAKKSSARLPSQMK